MLQPHVEGDYGSGGIWSIATACPLWSLLGGCQLLSLLPSVAEVLALPAFLPGPCQSSSFLFVRGKLLLLAHWCSLRQLCILIGIRENLMLSHSIPCWKGLAVGGWRTAILGFLSDWTSFLLSWEHSLLCDMMWGCAKFSALRFPSLFGEALAPPNWSFFSESSHEEELVF